MSFDALLKKYSVYVLLALVGAIAYFQAAGTMQLLGAALTTLTAAKDTATMPVAAVAVPISSAIPKDAEPILARNAFDSVTGSAQQESVGGYRRSSLPHWICPTQWVRRQCEDIRAAIITESPDPIWSDCGARRAR